MKRRLALTLQSDRGRIEGEGWWMDGSFLVVVTPERFDPGDPLEIHIDLGGGNGSVDTHAVVVEQHPSRTARGYVHSVQWLAHSQEDRDRILRVTADLKEPSTPPPPPPRTSRPPPARTSRPPPVVDARLAVQFAPGDPPSIYVGVGSLAQLARHITIVNHQVRLVLPRIEEFAEDDAVAVALRMPSGMFIQFDARVGRVGRRDVVIEGVGVPADTRVVLHELLDRAAG